MVLNIATYEELGVFLDGFVTLKRGPSPKKPNDDEAVDLTNNLILKKLRIALNLKGAGDRDHLWSGRCRT